MTANFFPKESINEFTSLIWTERFAAAGDVQIVVPPVPSMIKLLAPGTLLGLRGQKEVMVVDTHSIENGLLTINGSSLVKFLDQREAWFINPSYDGSDAKASLSAEYTDTTTAGQFLADVMTKSVINPVPFGSYWDTINLDWARDRIQGLSLGHVDVNGAAKQLTFTKGPLYSGIEQLGVSEVLGFKLYLESASYSASTYSLKFASYRGKNRTSEQTENLMVRFSPKLDSLSDVKEITSSADYKNTVYVYYKNEISIHYIPTLSTAPSGFDRRVILVEAPDIFFLPEHIAAFRQQVAEDAMRHHIYIQAVDGRVTSKIDYVFGVDYYLGDIIELEGFSGLLSKARVTEYIRSQDQYGEQEYPTLSVIDPLDTGWIGDLEPDSGWDPDWLDDPEWDDDWGPDDLPTDRDPLDTTSDPYDPNPDPVPDFSPTTTDDHGDKELSSLVPHFSADWYYDTDTGYYVHSGRVYVIGSANADGYDYLGSDTLLVNIPAELVPESPVSSRVMIDHVNSTYEYAYDSGLEIGPWLDVTIHPSGTVTLDGGNPFRAVDNNLDYTYLALILSSISWPTARAVADTPSTSSLDDYVASEANIIAAGGAAPDGDAWTNVDGTYAAHDGRFHIDGKLAVASPLGFDPLVGIQPMYQPKKLAVGGGGGSNGWCEVPQKDGYRFIITPASPEGYNHNLSHSGGAQNPQAVGNNGCGRNSRYFYARNSDGFLTRGVSVPIVFTPGTTEVGVAFPNGGKGSPINPLPTSAKWHGNTYSARVRFKPSELIQTGVPPIETSIFTGAGQFCFVLGIAPGISAYYKVLLTHDSVFDELTTRLFVVVSGGNQVPLAEATSGLTRDADGMCSGSWSVSISSVAADIGATPSADPETNYMFLGEQEAYDDLARASVGGKGNMGWHIPAGTSCRVDSAEISGTGVFPPFDTGDVIDFSGCGWPIT
ncbi:MAG: Gp37-like protein [Ktedonobacteraceae bacterium]